MNKVTANKLISLKAFFLGNDIRFYHREAEALSMILVAIETLSSKKFFFQNKKRLLFYWLLRCEILRIDSEVTDCRLTAKNISEEVDQGKIYGDYMKIVDQAIVKKRVFSFTDEYCQEAPHIGFLFDAIGLDYMDLTEQQQKFLNHTTLSELFKHHGVRFQ